ncbi:P-loop containing nucleoside triphosphate hydrolase protein [Bombardia bombarda]|uniref:P-loop containing nucleoside triphosphate hydrolase protein n=1 Tax=Bombardia bombarda TaxID=252184 RepID=A0AA39WUD6_9PEZI|nr:P-loop containing nucleoside triphosphate hydrolase protein [Bombardia bombarda]
MPSCLANLWLPTIPIRQVLNTLKSPSDHHHRHHHHHHNHHHHTTKMASSSPSSRTAHKDFFSAWAEFNSSPRSDVPLSTQLLLQKHHPSHHITRTSSSKFDLFGFAAAGHATAVLSFESPRLYNASRIYHSPKMRLVDAADPGSLSDDVDFGRWLYTYQDATFTVYRLQYLGVHGQTHKLLFVLAEDDPSTESSAVTTSPHHPRTDALLLAAAAWTHQLHNEIYVFDDSRWQKDADLWASIQGASWADVILDQSVKAGLEHDALSFFDNRALYHSLSVPWKRGIILHGVPGNGKTVSIKALINALAARSPPVPALYVKNLDSCSGDKWSIQMIFSQARKMAPCLLVLEDLDSIVRGKTRSYFLNEVDGLASNDGILMVGSTNHLGRLDDAITKRPSRFDRKRRGRGRRQRSRQRRPSPRW